MGALQEIYKSMMAYLVAWKELLLLSANAASYPSVCNALRLKALPEKVQNIVIVYQGHRFIVMVTGGWRLLKLEPYNRIHMYSCCRKAISE